MKKEKSCGAIVIDNDKVLIIKHNLGHWDFPKGHVEYDESEEETAIREVKEETNIDISINNKYRYMTKYSPKENVMKDVIYFLAKPLTKDIKVQEEEVEIAEFVTFQKALDLITYNNSKEIFIKLLDNLNI